MLVFSVADRTNTKEEIAMRNLFVLLTICFVFSVSCGAYDFSSKGLFVGKYEYDGYPDDSGDGMFTVAKAEMSISLVQMYGKTKATGYIKTAVKEGKLVASKYYLGLSSGSKIPITFQLGVIDTPFLALTPGSADILTVSYPIMADLQTFYMSGAKIDVALSKFSMKVAVLEREPEKDKEKQFQALLCRDFEWGFAEVYAGSRFDGCKNSFGGDIEIRLPVGTLFKAAYIYVDEACPTCKPKEFVFKHGYYILLAQRFSHWVPLIQYDWYDEESEQDQKGILGGINYYFLKDSVCIKLDYRTDLDDSSKWKVEGDIAYKFAL